MWYEIDEKWERIKEWREFKLKKRLGKGYN